MDDRRWSWLLGGLCLLGALALMLEFTQGIGPLMQGVYGSVGLEEGPGVDPARLGTHRLSMAATAPPDALALARPGDRFSFVDPIQRWRKLRPGETVALSRWPADGGPAQALTLSAATRQLTPGDYFDYLGRFLLAGPAVLFALLIGLKRRDNPACRALALCFVSLSLCFFFTFNFLPAGPLLRGCRLAHLLSYPLIWLCTVRFASGYSPARPRWMRRLLPAYTLLVALNMLTALHFGLGHEAPWLAPLLLTMLAGGLLLTYASMIAGWRAGGGETRQRHAWLLLAFSLGSLPATLAFLPVAELSIGGVPLASVAALIGQGLMYVGLAYAVLRHRVFNFDFAVSRALVYSAISLVVLIVFGVVKWATEVVLHGGELSPSLLGDGAIALGVYLVFHQIHDRLEHRIEHLFFQRWQQNEKGLRRFAKEAAHFSSSEALLSGLHRALERFSGGAGCAIYLKLAGGSLAQAFNTLPRAPPLLDADDGLVVAMRGSLTPLQVAEHETEAAGALAFALSHRGLLHGLVLLGAKAGSESYRPDETEVLEFAINQVGLDLQALFAAKLEQDLQRLARANETQRELLLRQRES